MVPAYEELQHLTLNSIAIIFITKYFMGANMHYGAAKKTFQLAAYLRNQMTPSENLLWHHLRNSSTGYKFRPQHPIWRFVVDFYCHEVKLVVEVDGSIHDLENIRLNDEDREKILSDFGLKIIRFSNEQVCDHIGFVVDQIQLTIADIKKYGLR